MQAAQREDYNSALELAIRKANELSLPLMVLFCIDDRVPEANLRHYHFMLEGLWEVGQSLQKRRIPLLFALGETEDILEELSPACAAVILDQGYLRWQKQTRRNIRSKLKSKRIPCLEGDTEVIVPVEIASPKEEYSAATLRIKLLKLLPEYLAVDGSTSQLVHAATTVLLPKPSPEKAFRYFTQMASAEELIAWVKTGFSLDESVSPVAMFKGGHRAALAKLDGFVSEYLPRYDTLHSDPGTNFQSDLSPYLHFGQISPLQIAHGVMAAGDLKPVEIPDLIRHKALLTGLKANCAAFLEQLIVRRELSMNFCHYNPDYDSYNSIP